jgi:hypothetical protein
MNCKSCATGFIFDDKTKKMFNNWWKWSRW